MRWMNQNDRSMGMHALSFIELFTTIHTSGKKSKHDLNFQAEYLIRIQTKKSRRVMEKSLHAFLI